MTCFSESSGGRAGRGDILPGLACVGYTFGLGSMSKLGGAGGWPALSLMLLAGVIFWALLGCSGRLALRSGSSLLRTWWCRGPAGAGLAIVVILGLAGAQWSGMQVLTHQLAGVVQLGIEQAWPATTHAAVTSRIALAGGFAGFVICCVRPGARPRLVLILAGLTVMTGLGLAGALLFSYSADWAPRPGPTAAGLSAQHAIPGIALAMPTFLLRPWLLGGRGMGAVAQRRDAIAGAVVFVALCVTAWAVGWRTVPGGARAEEMVRHLFLSGNSLAATCLIIGAIGAGLTSVFPMMIAVPVWIAECRGGQGELGDAWSVMLVGTAAVLAGAGLVVGDGMAGWHQLAGRAAQSVIPLLVVGGLWRELNRGDLAGQRAGLGIQLALGTALGFAAVGTVVSAGTFFPK